MQDAEVWLLTWVAKRLGTKQQRRERGYSEMAKSLEMGCEAEIVNLRGRKGNFFQ